MVFLLDINLIKKSLITKIDSIIPVIIFISTFLVYITFLAPSIFKGDSAEFCITAYILGIPHPNGFPVYTWIGHLFTMLPIGSVAYRVNLMSAFFGAVTVSLIYVIVLKIAILDKKIISDIKSSLPAKSIRSSYINVYRFIAVIAALSLAFSKTFWLQAEFAEVYTFNAFFIALMIVILLLWSKNRDNKFLYIFFLIYGLSIGAHTSNILFMPAFLVFIALINYKIFLNIKNVSLFTLLFIIGLSQFIYLLIRASQYPVYSDISPGLYGWLHLITAEQYSNYLIFSISEIPKRILMYLEFFKADFLLTGSILGIIGLIGLLKKNIKVFALLTLMFISNGVFFLNYYVLDVEVMFIPSFLLFSIFIGIGIAGIFDLIRYISNNFKVEISIKNMNINSFKLFTVFILLLSLLFIPITSYITNYNQIEQMDDDGFTYFAYTALKEVPSNSTIITYWKSYTAFKYFQIVDTINQNVTIIAVDDENLLNATDQNINKENLFVVHDTDLIHEKYNLVPVLDVPQVETMYKVEKKYYEINFQ